MRSKRAQYVLLSFFSLGFALFVLPFAAAAGSSEAPWRKLYSGKEATGENVIALWQFLPGQEMKDNSGHGHDLTLRGTSRFVKDGLFGSCLESFAVDAKTDSPVGATAKNAPNLTPAGAFTLECWFKPKPELARTSLAFLLDKKYYFYAKDIPQANWDYCLYLRRVQNDKFQIVAYLGYGKDSAEYASRPVPIAPGKWHHVAFTYNGAGLGRLFLDGEPVGRVLHEGRGPIAHGRYDLAIGDRYGSIHKGFPGYIDQVRICNGIVPYFTGGLQVNVTADGRTAFVRMEKNARVALDVINDTNTDLKKVVAEITFNGRKTRHTLPDLAADETRTIDFPVETALRPGSYILTATVSAQSKHKLQTTRTEIPIVIVPRPLPNVMPVVMWGTGDLKRLKEIGFTHHLVNLVDYNKVWQAGKPTKAGSAGFIAERAKMLNEQLAGGVGAIVYVYPGTWVIRDPQRKEKFQRIRRSGEPYEHANTCGLFPEVQKFCYNVGASVAQTFGKYPALQAALIHSEVRDGTNPCFHKHDFEAFKNFAGFDIPDDITAKTFRHYSTIPGFPKDHIIPDDNPILTYYRWFWKVGDGWNNLHTLVHRGLKSTGRKDLWTFFDPAVRAPSIWGSGGGVDVISQWTYSYPDPIKIGQATDELFAMAEGADHPQNVMKMTQIIWYRSQTAPELPKDEKDRAEWEKKIPDARFITIAPDHLREALWSKISRPIKGIMYHGWGSLVEASHGSYRYTNPKTRVVLAELIRKVIRPLGPTLLQVPDRKADVAVLESFTSQIFAGRGTWGWSGSWEADMHLILQWAHIQPRIVYEETILRDGLDDYKVLVMPFCDVLTKSVAEKILEFQRNGGLIVADEFLAPAINPDILVQSYKRTGKADEDKKVLQARAAELRKELDPFYTRHVEASNPDIVVRCRQYKNTDYFFALNDKRTFGHYVGHHGKVMEKGLPNEGTLSIRRAGGYVYDLVNHKQVPATRGNGVLKFDVTFGPGGGDVFMITDQKIAGVRIDAPESARRGATARIEVAVVDAEGEAISAVVPVQIEIIDASGQAAEFSGYYGAKDGLVSLKLDIAPNDPTGTWTIRATDLAADRMARKTFEVRAAN